MLVDLRLDHIVKLDSLLVRELLKADKTNELFFREILDRLHDAYFIESSEKQQKG